MLVASPSDTTDSRIDQIIWSPSGGHIAFAAAIGDLNEVSDVLVVNADGTWVLNLTNSNTLTETLVGWLGDSTRIIFIGEADSDTSTANVRGVFSITLDRADRTPVTDTAGNDTQAALSPVR